MFLIAISRDWELKQIDVSNAFLHGKLDERIVVIQLIRFEDSKYPNHVCLIQKSLYGLKQSSRMWYRRLREFLFQIGFKESYNDPSLFTFINQNDILYLFSYVDDIVITGSSPTIIRATIKKIGEKFVIRDLGDLGFFLGIHVYRTSTSL